ncbi:uncharacterized protein Z520_08069 [Fonsecaea multimorphosa CBS 102226]|uniref:Carbohydrate kinase PfkB domain-containing protein n=1 Tax=Fonsecaea multimorphosa CBS 102226 TaxID=1442371 RepID=A0A0D2IGV9_9EURO|nr:uncharacterized protein Z520_08069 [Fonsecaea multimorphosa CBS 102226]KIX96291.1 hypothetical protein Z520_08069 [Fonsecaea multimorphosa CBS 102226]OAL21952.1 hypothetical protein AYO22_07549 [Fonsecaea multimorphosa]
MAQPDGNHGGGRSPPDLEDRLAFCTMGMFIIDKIEYLANNNTQPPPQERIIGGAGTYAALGARLAAGSRHASCVGWIVDMGSDFPAQFRTLIETWRTACMFRFDSTRLTTTAWNGYGDNEFRAFKYLTSKRRLDENSLSDDQVQARAFHMVCSPTRCMALVRGILDRRGRLRRRRRGVLTDGNGNEDADDGDDDDDDDRPLFIWEPIPDLCTPEELSRLREATHCVDVVSPNADELASFFTEMPEFSTRERMVANLLGLDAHNGEQKKKPLSTRGTTTALVVREGAHGCTAYVGSTKGLHLRAYHQRKEKVVDPTGGGNTFLGALAMGMTGRTTPDEAVLQELGLLNHPSEEPVVGEKGRFLLALLHATIAAGYAIEQVGMPAVSAEDGDCWNGEAYPERFRQYVDRERDYILAQLSSSCG